MRARSASSTEVDSPKKRVLLLAAWYLPALLVASLLGRAFADSDAGAYDALLRLKCSLFPSAPDRRIVTVDMDDASLLGSDDPGAFRTLFAEVLDALAAAGPKVIVADVVFKDLRDPTQDGRLAASIRGAGTVILPVVLALPSQEPPGRGTWPRAATRILLGSQAMFRAAQAGSAHINIPPDRDGVYRRYPLAYTLEGTVVTSLALAAAAAYLDAPAEIAYRADRAMLSLPAARGGPATRFTVPLDGEGLALVPFRGGWEDSLVHLSAGAVVAAARGNGTGSELRDIVEGAIVLIGDTSSGGKDYGSVPVGTEYPLVGVHAAMIGALLSRRSIAPATAAGTALALAPVLLLQWLAMGARRQRDSGLLVALSLIAFAAVSLAAFLIGSAALHWNAAFLAASLAAAQSIAHRSSLAERNRARTRAVLGRYFSPGVTEAILARGEGSLAPEEREVSIIFTDIAGFTSWSKGRGPQEIHSLLRDYAEILTRIVFARGGTVDKFIGDGMLAFFNAPQGQSDHAERALAAALEIQAAFRGDALRGLALRAGINAGPVIVGDMGSDDYVNYTVVGSAVNLAQRLESAASRGKVLVSEDFFERIPPEALAGLELSRREIVAKGYEEPVRAVEIGKPVAAAEGSE